MDASVLGGTTKGRTGTGAPRSMFSGSPQKDFPNYNRQFSSGTGNKFGAEEFTTDAAGLIVVTQAGSASGSASVLNGVTTT